MGKIIEVKNVSVKYITGDLRNIGLKEFVMKKLTHQYRACLLYTSPSPRD